MESKELGKIAKVWFGFGGVPVEVTFKDRILMSWRVLKEVL